MDARTKFGCSSHSASAWNGQQRCDWAWGKGYAPEGAAAAQGGLGTTTGTAALVAAEAGDNGAQVRGQTLAVSDAVMETPLEKEVRAIRDTLDEVGGQIDRALGRHNARPAEEIRSLGWRCTGCGHIKHFTRPMPTDVAPPCPKCRGRGLTRSEKAQRWKKECQTDPCLVGFR